MAPGSGILPSLVRKVGRKERVCLLILLAPLLKQPTGPGPEPQRADRSLRWAVSPLLLLRFPGATSSLCETRPRAAGGPGASAQTSGKCAVQPTLSPNLDCQRPREAGEPAASAGALRRLGGRREAWKVRAEGPPGVPVRAALERLKQRRRASIRSSQASLLGSGARRWGPDRIPQIPPGSLVAKSHPTSSTFPLAPVSPGTLTLPHLVSGSLRTREIPAWTFRRKSE